MKKLLFSSLLLAVTLSLSAQDPFGKYATWHFTYSEFGYYGLKVVSYSKDTVINGMTWQKLDVSGISQIKTGPNWDDISQDTNARFEPILVATRNDSIFRMDDNQSPVLLYDFSGNVGDTWQYGQVDTTFGCQDTPIATITAKGTTTIDGYVLEYVDVTYPMDTLEYQGSKHYGNSSYSYMSNRIYRTFGERNFNGLFAPKVTTCDGTSFQLASEQMRCYQNMDVFINWTSDDCDAWSLLSTAENEVEPIVLYPNPSNGIVQLQFNSTNVNMRIELVDMSGRIARIDYTLNENPYTLQIENSGLYTLNVYNANGQLVASEKVIVQ